MKERRWTEEHGPDELYDKFKVIRKRTGEALDPEEFVFVLRPETDICACNALRIYAATVETRSPNLARQINERLDEINRLNRGLRDDDQTR